MVQMSQTLVEKEKKIQELQQMKSNQRIDQQLKNPKIQDKISQLQKRFEEQVCSELPTAFWERKTHFVEFPYKDSYKGKPCKSRAIPTNAKYQKLCAEEIQGLLKKGLIRESISPWNYYGFYVNKHSEQIRGVPILVVNYTPLNSVIADDTCPIPHKSSLVNRIANAKIFSKFDLKSGFWKWL